MAKIKTDAVLEQPTTNPSFEQMEQMMQQMKSMQAELAQLKEK
jgi:hypothetical protein